MPGNRYDTVFVAWNCHKIEVSFQANWLNSGQWYLELRSGKPLPVTATGYRSAFVPAVMIEDATEIESYVLAWLEQAADDPTWRRFLEESRQFKLL